MSLSLSVLSQSGPPKSVGGGGVGGRGGRGGGGRIPHFNWSIYRGGNFFFLFFFFESGLKLDKKSIENGLEGQKFLVVFTNVKSLIAESQSSIKCIQIKRNK